jgi:hypothetical protein
MAFALEITFAFSRPPSIDAAPLVHPAARP